METSLVVGIATNYDWTTLEPFVISLRRVYTGRCVLIIDAKTDLLTRHKLAQHNIEEYLLGDYEEDPIVIRFSVIPGIIAEMQENLKYVICVDTKDVVFQYDPTVWLDKNLGDKELAIVSEGSTYAKNVGNGKNCVDAYGAGVFAFMSDKEVHNAGVIAGRPEAVRRLCTDIYHLCQKDLRLATMKPTYETMLPDQTAMNILLYRPDYFYVTKFVHASDGLSFCGVFSKVHLQQDNADLRDSVMYPKHSNTPFAIFHQYFAWQPEIREKYRESN